MTATTTTILVQPIETRSTYTHVVLGMADKADNDSYWTRVGYTSDSGRWTEVMGHYDMQLTQAVEDYLARIKRGY